MSWADLEPDGRDAIRPGDALPSVLHVCSTSTSASGVTVERWDGAEGSRSLPRPRRTQSASANGHESRARFAAARAECSGIRGSPRGGRGRSARRKCDAGPDRGLNADSRTAFRPPGKPQSASPVFRRVLGEVDQRLRRALRIGLPGTDRAGDRLQICRPDESRDGRWARQEGKVHGKEEDGRHGDRGHDRAEAAERGPRGGDPLEEVGPVPQRAAVGHGPRGLQRERQRVGLLHPRPVPLPGLPVGRGRPRRVLRRQAAPVLRPRPLERAGPHPQGARVRPHQQRGEPRRGRQGVLLLRRLDADPLVHEVPLQVPAARVPLPGPRRDEPAAHEGGARVRAPRHGGLRGRPVLRRLPRVRQGGAGGHPDQGVGPQPRARRRPGCTCSRRCGSGTPGRGETRERSRSSARRAGRSWPPIPSWASTRSRAAASRSSCSRRTSRTRRGSGASRTRRRT